MRRNESVTTFVDLMCPDRVLVLSPSKSDTPDVVTARVFWVGNTAGKSTRVFGGITKIPRRLLFVETSSGRERRGARFHRRDEGDDQRERIGYMWEGAYQRKLEREAQEDRRTHREDYEE